MDTTTAGLAREHVAADEAAVIADFIAFLKRVSAQRHPTGVVKRFNQARHAGCVEATFTVLDALPDAHRVGLLARPRTFPAWIRFAHASSQSDRDKDIRGMSITVRDVDGANLTPGATSQDFVLNSHPVMVAPDTRNFLELLQATEAGGFRRALYFLTHPRSARIGLAARQHHTCHLDIRYWSTTPYLFGPGRAVKYIVRPTSARTSRLPDPLTDTYMHDALKVRLEETDATFDFMIQFQHDERATPIEDASVEWMERDAPYVTVARIHIPAQDIDTAERMAACERVAFNPWHCLADHRPLGNFNRARRDIYRAMAEVRGAV